MNLRRSLDVRLPEQFSLIENLKESHAVALIWDEFRVNRSSYKYWIKRPSIPSLMRIKLHREVRSAHQDSNGSAGARMIASIVTARGIQRNAIDQIAEASQLPITKPSLQES